jgi:hypothetical protein
MKRPRYKKLGIWIEKSVIHLLSFKDTIVFLSVQYQWRRGKKRAVYG